MRCHVCHSFSVSVVCAACAARLLTPNTTRRQVGSLEVVSLFRYAAIEPFLLTKHTPVGHRIYRFLGRRYLAPFVAAFADHADAPFALMAIDDTVRYGYAHTALLTRAVRHPDVRVLHGTLRARNRVRYAGKTLQYRLDHPRDFRYTGPHVRDAVIVDDIVTTGLTLQEAQQRLKAAGINVLFALTLADAQA